MLNSYNRIASFYPFLGSLMYGKNLLLIQNLLIQELPKTGNLLILGGGNGKILPLIFAKSPELEVTYMEASSKMIVLARQEAPSGLKIEFVHGSDLSLPNRHFDYVYTGFLLDLFPESKIIKTINDLETIDGHQILWFVADFDLGIRRFGSLIRWIQIKMSIIFFRLFTKHPIKYLPNVFQVFRDLGYTSLTNKELGSGFYRAEVFKK